MSTKTPELTGKELLDMLLHQDGEGSKRTFNVWLKRGDGIAVYENKAMDSSQYGARQYMSFGSVDALWEGGDPPLRMPDIGQSINWMYQLVGTYRGDVL